jgi:hypothetical protein
MVFFPCSNYSSHLALWEWNHRLLTAGAGAGDCPPVFYYPNDAQGCKAMKVKKEKYSSALSYTLMFPYPV